MVQERYYFIADNDRVQFFSSDTTYSHSFGKEVQPVQWTWHLTHGYTVSTKLETCMIHLHNYNDNANLLVY